MEIYRELKEYGVEVDVYDPWADVEEVYTEYGIMLKEALSSPSLIEQYDAFILTTAHREFLTIDINTLKKEKSVVFDAKSILPRTEVDARL